MNEPKKPAEFTIKVSTVIILCLIGAVILAGVYFVGVTLLQGLSMK